MSMGRSMLSTGQSEEMSPLIGDFFMPIQDISSQLNNLPYEQRSELLKLLEEYSSATARQEAQRHFIPFVKQLWPEFIHGRHHQEIANAFERVLSGDCKRLIINLAPRHSKSEMTSVYLPAWFLGRFPDRKIIQATHTSELAVGFGRRVRNIVGSDEYKKIFGSVSLALDSKAAGRWNTNKGGEYFAVGVGSAVAGKGADLFVIDDPIDEQTAQFGEYRPEVYDKVNDWYGLVRQRLQPNGAIILLMTRWSKRDLTGFLTQRMIEEPNGDQWELIELPAMLPSGEPLWPEYWSKDELLITKSSIPISRWNAQYMQTPTAEEGALIKREWWQRWDKPKPPAVNAILVSWDTAYEKTQRADYSACTTWGIFEKETEEGSIECLILLDAFKGKWEFPELKKVAKAHYIEWEPDITIIEAKAAGSPLIYELRAMGIPVQEFKPSRGNDKIARVNSITDIFASGMVYAPDTTWANEVIEECASFPAGQNDDLVDTVSQALIRFRKGGFLRLENDDDEDDWLFKLRRRAEYY